MKFWGQQDKSVLLYSQDSADRGLYPWHIESLERWNKFGDYGHTGWHIFFDGTQAECSARLQAELAKEPPPDILSDQYQAPRPTAAPARKSQPHGNQSSGRMKFPESGEMRQGLRYEILKRDGYRCKHCGHTAAEGYKLHVDHIIPRAKGGTNDRANLQTLCEACNNSKSDD